MGGSIYSPVGREGAQQIHMPELEFCLVKVMAMNIGCEHPKGDIKDLTDGGIGFLEIS